MKFGAITSSGLQHMLTNGQIKENANIHWNIAGTWGLDFSVPTEHQ